VNAAKREALKQAGFRVGTVQEFLGLENWENRLVELKYQLSKRVKERREALGLTQQGIARKIHSSQSRVAKIEAGSEDVSLDLLIRYLYAVGGQLGESDPEEFAPSKQPVKRVATGGVSGGSRRKKRVHVS
jgi:DNA-binding XRE family transcriptional regulator